MKNEIEEVFSSRCAVLSEFQDWLLNAVLKFCLDMKREAEKCMEIRLGNEDKLKLWEWFLGGIEKLCH